MYNNKRIMKMDVNKELDPWYFAQMHFVFFLLYTNNKNEIIVLFFLFYPYEPFQSYLFFHFLYLH